MFIDMSDDPNLNYDCGAGPWAGKVKGADPKRIQLKRAEVLAYKTALGFANTPTTAGYRHLLRYFENKTGPQEVDLQRFINEVPSANRKYSYLLAELVKHAHKLEAGKHPVTMIQAHRTGVGYAESFQWYYAFAQYWAWIKGVATVGQDISGNRQRRLEFECKIADRYNWDIGLCGEEPKTAQIPIAGQVFDISDKYMGEFHQLGLAREFDIEGSAYGNLEWDNTPGRLERILEKLNVRHHLQLCYL